MLRYIERSTIYYLKQKGWSNVQIAQFTGPHHDTVARVLREEVDKKPKTRERSSAVAVFDAQIAQWLEQNMLVIAPLSGSFTKFDFFLGLRRTGVARRLSAILMSFGCTMKDTRIL